MPIDYDYAGNFAYFLDSKNVTKRVVELAKRKWDLADDANDYEIIQYLMKRKDRCEIINALCTWGNQQEGVSFWSNLNGAWNRIASSRIKMKFESYKSIW